MIAAERKTALLNAMQKLEAYRQIQNEMGRAVAAFNFRQADRLLSFFALDKADVSLEYADEGVFNGPEAVKAIVNDVVGKEPEARRDAGYAADHPDYRDCRRPPDREMRMVDARRRRHSPGGRRPDGHLGLGRAGSNLRTGKRRMEDLEAPLFPLYEMRL